MSELTLHEFEVARDTIKLCQKAYEGLDAVLRLTWTQAAISEIRALKEEYSVSIGINIMPTRRLEESLGTERQSGPA